MPSKTENVSLGLRENWVQFTILVIVNAFVGGMIGLERTLMPELAVEEFGISANTGILSFILIFGISKAIANYYTGFLADRFGRKHLLVAGWVLALPVPLILIMANSWAYVLLANVLLGVHQGLCWSSTVVMKIDLVGKKERGLAMGLNEAAGYLAVGLVAFATGWIASEYGLRPYPFYLGIILAITGLASSLWLVRDTRSHMKTEAKESVLEKLGNVFMDTSWKNPNLGSITFAGLVNNLNDGMVWGLLPMILASRHFRIEEIGLIVAMYPAVWGVGQVATGKLADLLSKKKMLIWGMVLQSLVLLGFMPASEFWHFFVLSVLLGVGTAIVYPTFLAAISEHTHPAQRAESIGVFRFWRDLGYAIGALATGLIADWLGLEMPLLLIGLLTLFSGLVLWRRMDSART